MTAITFLICRRVQLFQSKNEDSGVVTVVHLAVRRVRYYRF